MDQDYNFLLFNVAVKLCAAKFFNTLEHEAEIWMDKMLQKTDYQELMKEHPFFIAARLANINPAEAQKKFLQEQHEIGKIWP